MTSKDPPLARRKARFKSNSARFGVFIHLGSLCGLIVLGSTACSPGVTTCRQVQRLLAHSTSRSVIPAAREEGWWKERQAAVKERISGGDFGLLFVGDSITQGWENHPELWNAYFGRWEPLNEGFRGDRTEHVLWRLQNGGLDGLRPRVVVVMIGTNNSGGDEYSAEQIAEGIGAIVCTLRTKLPDAKILLLGIFPRGSPEQRSAQAQNAAYNSQWAKNDRASRLASRLAENEKIFFLDLNKNFLDGQGVLVRDVMPDLLHLSERGYRIWGDALRPAIERLLSEK